MSAGFQLFFFISASKLTINPDGLGATVHNDGNTMGVGYREDTGQEWMTLSESDSTIIYVKVVTYLCKSKPAMSKTQLSAGLEAEAHRAAVY